jgi:hypothetical protein
MTNRVHYHPDLIFFVGSQVVTLVDLAGWRYPEGHGLSLDVCPVGPHVPAREWCLDCGTPYPSDAADARYGERAACQGTFPWTRSLLTPLPVPTRFAQGLFRRGMAILNQESSRPFPRSAQRTQATARRAGCTVRPRRNARWALVPQQLGS